MSLVLYHCPRTRSSGVMCLLEELGVDYDLRVLNLPLGAGRTPEFLAVNPLGKVPALVDDGAVVTEQAAIFLHLADRFPGRGLAPPPGDPMRGPYLRWTVFYAASFEPAAVDRATERPPAPQAMSPYGSSFDEVVGVVRGMLAPGPWVLGGRFSAADILWGTALEWTMAFGLVPRLPEFEGHVARLMERPAMRRARRRDELIAARQPRPKPEAEPLGA